MQCLALIPLAAALLAQNPQVFQTTTQLVQIDVAAEDNNGKPVPGLTKEDFELKVNGKPQSIDTFAAISNQPAAPATELPPGVFTNKQQASEVTRGRYTAFVLDWRNTNWQLQSWSHQQLIKMLSDAPPANKVALYLINKGFQIVQEFTLDHERLLIKSESLWGQVPPPFTNPAWEKQSATDSAAAFKAIAKHLEGISGQKILVWISTGFTGGDEIDDAVHVLGNANIVLEAADARYLNATLIPQLGPTKDYDDSLHQIAERTGGRYFGPSNNLAVTLSEAAADRAVSYQLGYYLAGDLPPGLQPFTIRCKRPNVALRYREGYFVDKYPAPQPDPITQAKQTLEGAVDAVAIPLMANVSRTMGNRSRSVILRLTADANAITLQHQDTQWFGKLQVLARFASDEDDQFGDVPLDAPTIQLTEAQHNRAMREGVNMRFTMKLPEGATTLRVLVRDDASGRAGSITIPVADLPEP